MQDLGLIRVPAPTPWPFIMGFGVMLLFAGLVTSAGVSVLGGALVARAAVGWFKDVLPVEATELVVVGPPRETPALQPRAVAHVEVASQLRRAWLPLEIYPVAAGVRGGLAGSLVMALLAMAYGLFKVNSIWYPINLLAAGFVPGAAALQTREIAAFHAGLLAIATAIHLATSLLVGLLYGAMLPMLPRRPIVLGGLVAPFAWSALLHSVLGVVNPVMDQRIDWFWFVLSQVGFGLAAGLVVSRGNRVQTWQRLPLALRAGLEAPGLIRERDDSRPS
jgi:hypothetical protein